MLKRNWLDSSFKKERRKRCGKRIDGKWNEGIEAIGVILEVVLKVVILEAVINEVILEVVLEAVILEVVILEVILEVDTLDVVILKVVLEVFVLEIILEVVILESVLEVDIFGPLRLMEPGALGSSNPVGTVSVAGQCQ